MNSIKEVNELLGKFPYPLKTALMFTILTEDGKLEKVDVYLLWEKRNVRIILREPFFYGTTKGGSLVPNEVAFRKIETRTDFEIQSMSVNQIGELTISCDKGAAFKCMPGASFGWGLYAGTKEIAQHYGLDEGIELDHEFKGFES